MRMTTPTPDRAHMAANAEEAGPCEPDPAAKAVGEMYPHGTFSTHPFQSVSLLCRVPRAHRTAVPKHIRRDGVKTRPLPRSRVVWTC